MTYNYVRKLVFFHIEPVYNICKSIDINKGLQKFENALSFGYKNSFKVDHYSFLCF